MAIILSSSCGSCAGVTSPCPSPFAACEVYYVVTTAWTTETVDFNRMCSTFGDWFSSQYSMATPPGKTGETTFSITQTASGPTLIVTVGGTDYTAALGPWVAGYDGTYTGTLSGGLGGVSVVIETPFPGVTSLYANTCGGGGVLSRNGPCRFSGSFSGAWLIYNPDARRPIFKKISGTLSFSVSGGRCGYSNPYSSFPYGTDWAYQVEIYGEPGGYSAFLTETCGFYIMGDTWQEALSSYNLELASHQCSTQGFNPLLFNTFVFYPSDGDCFLTIS